MIYSDLQAQQEEIEEIKGSIVNGTISARNFQRLLDIAGFDDELREGLTLAFTAAGKIIPDAEDSIGGAKESGGRQVG